MSSRTDRRFTQIGLDRMIRRTWLESTASMLLAGNDASAVKATLQSQLQGSFRSTNVNARGSIDKTITILLRVWVRPPNELIPLRDRAIELLRKLPESQHLAVQWGMLGAVYPFWLAVATQIGRLLKLQGSAAATQIQRRLREQFGERETVSRRVRYVIRSFVDWGVLSETEGTGFYKPGITLKIEEPELKAWLVETALHARPEGAATLRDLVDDPGLFPLRIGPVNSRTLQAAGSRIEIHRHGLDSELVLLSKRLTGTR